MANIGFKEDLTKEFKSDKNYLRDNEIIDAVVAFCNTDGGELYLGVEDDGEITGLHKDHMDTTRLAAFIANKTVPPVAVRTEILQYDYPVLKISVPKRTSIVASSSGKIQRRRIQANGTPENVPMYPYEINSRLSSLSLLDYSAQPVPDSAYEDLDAVERERLRNIIRTYRGDASLLELNNEELDKALRLAVVIDGKLTPTFCGMLLIGKKEALEKNMPTAEASIQIFSGTDIKVNESFTLPVLAAFEKISDYFSAYNGSEEMEMGLYRITIYDYDIRAFREALVNAFCHRDYSMLGRVRIQINEEGMTITNPGGFIEGINADNLLEAEPHGRNTALADAMKRIGLAERTGRGIDRIYEGSLIYGRALPSYAGSAANMVKLFISKGNTDKEFIRMVSNEQQRLGKSLPIYSLLALDALKRMGKLSVNDIAEELKIEENRAKSTVESLVNSGIVEAIGAGRGRSYILSAKYYNKTKKPAVYVRQKGIDSIRYSEMVIQLTKSKGFVTRSDVVELLHVNNAQAYRILNRLVKENRLELSGAGAGAKYIIPNL
ncbi:MAG: putative DNA binding domain-containing protein [Clostridiales bacterium]|nr:putative DNA binding domain-containing protein [Clostridiales bacterium]